MGTQLRQILWSLCFNTQWNYAVFWKLTHRAPMMLTWEDTYYDNIHEQPDSEKSRNECGSHDPLGLAMANMSCHVYSLGEGIVGQVAATGNHMWIFADKHKTDNPSSFEHCEGWQPQISAGIRTVIVVDVLPHGVVQLGSINEIAEDLQLVNHIRDIFLAFKYSPVGCNPSRTQCHGRISSCMSEISGSSCSGIADDCMSSLDRIVKSTNNGSLIFPTHGALSSQGYCNDKNIHNATFPADKYGLGSSCFPSNLPESADFDNKNGGLYKLAAFDLKIQKDMENLKFQTEFSQMHTMEMSYNFLAGCELYEALGPAFGKQRVYFDSEASKTETEVATNMPAEIESSGCELLEAVVANVSTLTTENIPESTSDKYTTVDSVGFSYDPSIIDEGTIQCLSSSKGFSSTSLSTCSERLERTQEPAKANKKRAKPGENCRPRPRDRQLIQDRIKELRELVPSGSKCSIDSLLERTIKHMLFLQSVTKHADKLSKSTASKLRPKERGIQGFPSYEQGSSWAVEVGNQLKVCPILVENINSNGQMVIEMLCEKCCHFLEIAEAVRSLGMTILKSTTEDYGEKTWICFIVEGQNNRSLHRMDILWSLVQTLQSKTSTT